MDYPEYYRTFQYSIAFLLFLRILLYISYAVFEKFINFLRKTAPVNCLSTPRIEFAKTKILEIILRSQVYF